MIGSCLQFLVKFKCRKPIVQKLSYLFLLLNAADIFRFNSPVRTGYVLVDVIAISLEVYFSHVRTVRFSRALIITDNFRISVSSVIKWRLQFNRLDFKPLQRSHVRLADWRPRWAWDGFAMSSYGGICGFEVPSPLVSSLRSRQSRRTNSSI